MIEKRRGISEIFRGVLKSLQAKLRRNGRKIIFEMGSNILYSYYQQIKSPRRSWVIVAGARGSGRDNERNLGRQLEDFNCGDDFFHDPCRAVDEHDRYLS